MPRQQAIRMLPLSLDLARDLVVDASPAASLPGMHGADAGSIRFLILALSQAASSARETDEMEREYRLTEAYRHGVEYARHEIDLPALRRAMAGAVLTTVRAALSRCCDSLVTLRGLDGYGLSTPTNKVFLGPKGTFVRDGDELASLGIEATLLAAATPGYGGTVEVDAAALNAFRCRYSPVLYLRCLAWEASPAAIPRGCEARRQNGTLRLTLPLGEAQEILGFRGIAKPSQMERTALNPACAELAAAGFRVAWSWVTNYRGERTGIRLSVARNESLGIRTRTASAQARAEAAEARHARLAERRIERAKRPRKTKRPPRPAARRWNAAPPATRDQSKLRAALHRPPPDL